MSKKRKPKRSKGSPYTTAYIPPDTEYPKPDEGCIRAVAEEIILEKIGHLQLRHTTIISPVILELYDSSGQSLDKWEWDLELWPCLSEFADNIRYRLTKLIDSQLPSLDFESMEILVESIRDSLFDKWGISDIGELKRSGDPKALAQTWLRDSMGLERKQPQRTVARIAGTRLNRWMVASEKVLVRQARAITKLLELM